MKDSLNLSRKRNTSTCVEKMKVLGAKNANKEKHLHVRGEDRKKSLELPAVRETPPRAWRRLDRHVKK